MPRISTDNYDTVASWNGSQDLFVVEQPDGTKVATPAMVKQFIEAGDFESTGEIKDGHGNILKDMAKSADVATALAGKQDTLTFDNVPTQNSNNPVKSGGVAASLAEKSNIGAASTNAATISELVDYCRGVGSTDIGHVHFGISNYSISQVFGSSRFTFFYRFTSANYGWILCISDNSTMAGIKLLQIVQYPNVYMQTPTVTIEKIQ